ncbi:MAG: outer membrane beta-barrel protein [Chitinophagaceae bacterium]
MKMLLIAGMLLMGTAVCAQNSKHELSVGYGIGTTSEILDVFSDMLASAFTAGGYSTTNDSYTGAFHVTYKYLFPNKLSLGGTFAYESGKADVMYSGVKNGETKKKYYSGAVEADYRYVNKPAFSLYSGLGLGFTSYHEEYIPDGRDDKSSDNMTHFNFQIIGIGVRFGTHIGGFAEAGFGYKGIIAAGVFARF